MIRQAVPRTRSAATPRFDPPAGKRQIVASAGWCDVRVFYWTEDAVNGAAPDVAREAMRYAVASIQTMDRLGFERPQLIGNNLVVNLHRFDRDFIGSAPTFYDGIYTGFEIELSLRADALKHTILHEYVHIVQLHYVNSRPQYSLRCESGPGPMTKSSVMEGGARALEEVLGTGAMRYIQDAGSWLVPGGTSLFSHCEGTRRQRVFERYSSGLFWKYVGEQHGNPFAARAADPAAGLALTQRALLEAVRRHGAGSLGEPGVAHIRYARSCMHGHGHFDRFLHLDDDKTMLVSSETTWGNFLVALAINGRAGLDTRFRFEDEARWPQHFRRGQGIRPEFDLDYLGLPEDALVPTAAIRRRGGAFGRVDPDWNAYGAFGPSMVDEERHRRWLQLLPHRLQDDQAVPAQEGRRPIDPVMLAPYSMKLFRVRVVQARPTIRAPTGSYGREPSPLLRVRFRVEDGLNDALVQIVTLGENGLLADLYRHDGAPPPTGAGTRALDRTFRCRGASEILILVCSREHAGNFRLALTRPVEAAMLHVTNWGARPGRDLTDDGGRHARRWRSPDIRVPTKDGMDEVHVRVRNRGNQVADVTAVHCWRIPNGMTNLRAPRPEDRLPPIAPRIEDFANRITPDDECRWLFESTPLHPGPLEQMNWPARNEPGGSCHLPQYDENEQLRHDFWEDERALKFAVPGGMSGNDLIVFQIEASNDPNGTAVALHSYRGDARLPPEWVV
jgi:hypothetical protein